MPRSGGHRRGHERSSTGQQCRPPDDGRRASTRRQHRRSGRSAVNAERFTERGRTAGAGRGLGNRHNSTSSRDNACTREPSSAGLGQLPSSRSRGRGIELTMPAWLVARTPGSPATTRDIGGLQNHATPGTGNSRTGPSTSTSSSLGRSLHRTVPAWRVAARDDDKEHTDHRLGGLQHALTQVAPTGAGQNNSTPSRQERSNATHASPPG